VIDWLIDWLIEILKHTWLLWFSRPIGISSPIVRFHTLNGHKKIFGLLGIRLVSRPSRPIAVGSIQPSPPPKRCDQLVSTPCRPAAVTYRSPTEQIWSIHPYSIKETAMHQLSRPTYRPTYSLTTWRLFIGTERTRKTNGKYSSAYSASDKLKTSER